MSREPENWHFSYTAAPAGEAWAALGGPSLQPWAAQLQVGLATGGVNRVIHSVTLQCGWAGSVHSLTGQQNNMGGRDVERSLNYKYNAQLDGQNG